MSQSKYTKAQLEQIVSTQLENLNAMNDLLRIMKIQNELLDNANKKFKNNISDLKTTFAKYPTTMGKKKQ